MDGSMPRSARPQLLTANERAALQERRLNGATRQRLAALLDEEKPVVLRDAVRTAKRARFDLRGCAGDC